MGSFGLAWRRDGRRRLAAADAAALRRSGDRLDRGRLAEFFANAELSGDHSFFAGVREVAPGELLLLEPGGERRRALARPDPARSFGARRPEEWVGLFAERLERAVRRCLAGAGEVAVLGGGGLDSSTIAVLAAAELRRAGRTVPALIAWRVEGAESDESGYATELGAALAARVEWVDARGAEPFEALDRWPVHPATPEQTAYRWLHQRAYERAATLGARTLLAGFGGDSLYTHGDRWLFGLLAAGEVGAAVDALRAEASAHGWPRALARHLVRPLAPRRPAPPVSAPWLTAATRRRLAAPAPDSRERCSARRPRQAVRLLARLDGHGEQVERHYTSALGLEQRTPWRDFDLVELALGLPDRLLGRGGETRTVLREAMRGRLPERIRTRAGKASFRRLLVAALSPPRLAWARPRLERRDALWRGFVEPEAMSRWLDGRFANDGEIVGLLHAIYAELWRDREGLGGVDSVADD
jgi:asparagine synthase (glutamine-hydrolysing)